MVAGFTLPSTGMTGNVQLQMKSNISGKELNSVVQMHFTKNKIAQRYE